VGGHARDHGPERRARAQTREVGVGFQVHDGARGRHAVEPRLGQVVLPLPRQRARQVIHQDGVAGGDGQRPLHGALVAEAVVRLPRRDPHLIQIHDAAERVGRGVRESDGGGVVAGCGAGVGGGAIRVGLGPGWRRHGEGDERGKGGERGEGGAIGDGGDGRRENAESRRRGAPAPRARSADRHDVTSSLGTGRPPGDPARHARRGRW